MMHANGERLVSAARDGDLQEAKALLEYNPRLARYSTFGVRNSPLHYSAAQGHHEIVSLLIESGVDINLRNISGQTALMQACQYGHWEVVQTLMLFKANIHRTDYLNGGTALHLAALNGHTRCVRLLLTDYVPSIPEFWNMMRGKSTHESSIPDFDKSSLSKLVNQKADGGITALHMAALNGHAETMHLLLDLGASVSQVTVEDGSTIDLIGAGSSPLHYASCGGSAVCCEVLIARGASLDAENSNGIDTLSDSLDFNQILMKVQIDDTFPCWTPLMVARSWHRNWLEGILSNQPDHRVKILPSPYMSLPLMSIMRIAREFGWRSTIQSPACIDPCVVCLERRCTVAAEGCNHEFCTRCALYLCSTNSTSTILSLPPGSIPCPLCRHAIVSFAKIPGMSPMRELPRTSLSLSLCATCPAADGSDSTTPMATQLCKPDFHCTRIPPLGSSSFCMGVPETSSCLMRCSRSLRRSASQGEGRGRSCLFALSHIADSS
nr:PREDICTED: probable E3 ubiquitin-protein ligase XBOS32 isoform X2 [Musa acuminata subsp. malaccensis]